LTSGSKVADGAKEFTSTQNIWKPRIIDSLLSQLIDSEGEQSLLIMVLVLGHLLDKLTIHLVPHFLVGHGKL